MPSLSIIISANPTTSKIVDFGGATDGNFLDSNLQTGMCDHFAQK